MRKSPTTPAAGSMDPIELMTDAGFDPCEVGEVDGLPTWADGRFDGVIMLQGGNHGMTLMMLTATYSPDQVHLVLQTTNGVIHNEMRFSAPDETIDHLTAVAFVAVVNAWVAAVSS